VSAGCRVDIEGANVNNGALLVQWDCTGGANQKCAVAERFAVSCSRPDMVEVMT
jgi:hypothetical protein